VVEASESLYIPSVSHNRHILLRFRRGEIPTKRPAAPVTVPPKVCRPRDSAM